MQLILPYPLPLGYSGEEAGSIQIVLAGQNRQLVDLLSPTQGCSSSPARIVLMKQGRKLIFHSSQVEGDGEGVGGRMGSNIPAGLMARLREELIFHI